MPLPGRLQLLALELILCLALVALVSASENSYDAEQDLTSSDLVEKEQGEPGQRGGEQENLKRYLFTDLDADGSARASSRERWKLIRLNQLLESLNDVLPSRSPLYRSGRTFGGPFGIEPRASSRSSSAKVRIPVLLSQHELEQQLDHKLRTKKPTLIGLVWQPNADNNANVSRQKSSPGAGSTNQRGEEAPVNSPMHTQSGSDYEYKRVENSRWNNLRGMWGKRSPVTAANPRADEELESVAM